MAVPYTFGTATSSIPLSQLDSNFNTVITLGNTAIQLGNTVTTLNNMTLANVTISSGNVTITNVAITTANVTTANITTAVIGTATITTSATTTANVTTANITTANITNGTVITSLTLSYGTANGVAFLNGSKVLTTGSALTYDGASFGVSGTGTTIGLFTSSAAATTLAINNTNANAWGSNLAIRTGGVDAGYFGTIGSLLGSTSQDLVVYATASNGFRVYTNGNNERMRILSTGEVGIGTNSPTTKLTVSGTTTINTATDATAGLIVKTFGTSGGTQPIANFQRSDAGINLQIGFNGVTGDSFFGTTTNHNLYFISNNTEKMRIDVSGIVTMNAYGAGAATFSAAGVISSVSDETWKIKDGVPVDPDSMLKKLEPGYWYYNDEKKETFGVDRQLGFYAQNVNSAIGPEAAPTPEEGKPWGYYDRSVLAVTVMSLQKALATIETLTARITALEST